MTRLNVVPDEFIVRPGTISGMAAHRAPDLFDPFHILRKCQVIYLANALHPDVDAVVDNSLGERVLDNAFIFRTSFDLPCPVPVATPK